MSDFLTRLSERTLGMGSVVQPRIAPRFAPEVITQVPDPEWDGEAFGDFEEEVPSSSRALPPSSMMAEQPKDAVIDRWETRGSGVPTESGPPRREAVAVPTPDSPSPDPPPESRARREGLERALPPPADPHGRVEEDVAQAAQASQQAQEGNHEPEVRARVNTPGQTELTRNTDTEHEAPHSTSNSQLGSPEQTELMQNSASERKTLHRKTNSQLGLPGQTELTWNTAAEPEAPHSTSNSQPGLPEQTELMQNTAAERKTLHRKTNSQLGPDYSPQPGPARREVVEPPALGLPSPEPSAKRYSEEDVTGNTPENAPSGPRSTKKVSELARAVGPLAGQRSDTNPQTANAEEARPTIDVSNRRPDEAVTARPRDREGPPPIAPSRTRRAGVLEARHTYEPDSGLYDETTSLPESPAGSSDSPDPSGDVSGRTVPRLTRLVEPGKRVSLSPRVASGEQRDRPSLEAYPATSAVSDLLRVAPRMAKPDVGARLERDSPEAPPTAPETSPPTIHVNIGRVEVRAAMPPPAPPRQQAAPPKKLSLDEYLRSRSSEGRP